MARKPTTRVEFTLFDVVYEDGSQRSNRRVPSDLLGGLDGDAPARAIIEEQDRLIAEKSGTPAIAVKSIHRSGSRKADEAMASSRYASASGLMVVHYLSSTAIQYQRPPRMLTAILRGRESVDFGDFDTSAFSADLGQARDRWPGTSG